LFFYRPGPQAMCISRQALPLIYQTFDQLASYNGDEKDVQRESQDQSPFAQRAKNYQFRDARPCPAYDECENRAQSHAFPTSAALIGIRRPCPHGRTSAIFIYYTCRVRFSACPSCPSFSSCPAYPYRTTSSCPRRRASSLPSSFRDSS